MAAGGRPRPAAVAEGGLQEQWRSLDGLLDSLSRRARGYAAADDEEEAPVAPAAGLEAPQLSALRQERDQLRRLLAAANADLRAARAEIREMRQRLRRQHNAEVSRGLLARWWTRWSRRPSS